MLNDFTGGGQIFLHKMRMFFQVLGRSCLAAFVVGITLLVVISYKVGVKFDFKAAMSYQKALLAGGFDNATRGIREQVNPSARDYYTKVDAYDYKGLYAKDTNPRKILATAYFKRAHQQFIEFLKIRLLWSMGIMSAVMLLLYLVWTKFGQDIKTERQQEGSDRVLSAIEVRDILKNDNKDSNLCIGNMPLVRDSETRHFLVTGSTGSGKTNLIHNILSQVERQQQPAIVIDQTGEMIAKYYDASRGDIIFNPFDARGSNWDFFGDCSTDEEIEHFARVLFGFNRKKAGHSGDPFWEQSAETVFTAIVKQQRNSGNGSIEQISALAQHTSLQALQPYLRDTEASRYLEGDSKSLASSVLSVMATSTKPISYLRDINSSGSDTNAFSLKEHFNNIAKQNTSSWLFLATKPSARELTLPLIACLTELALSKLLDIGIKRDRKIWFVIDELAALGKLPALPMLMAEGRKYGACVLSGLQSLNQLYNSYGQYEGSTIFGQFGTSFFFRNNEPAIAKIVSSMCGTETIYRQQRGVSFGAHEIRDGVSYNEQQQHKQLVEYSDLAGLAVGECYVLLPEPSVRVAKIQTTEADRPDKNAGFVPVSVLPVGVVNHVNLVVGESTDKNVGASAVAGDARHHARDTSLAQTERKYYENNHGLSLERHSKETDTVAAHSLSREI